MPWFMYNGLYDDKKRFYFPIEYLFNLDHTIGGGLYYRGDSMITFSRSELIELLSYKGFTTDKLMGFDDETLENLYIEYIVLAEDYV